ncbi:MAG: SWIM zinc finger domain-containing protein [Oscillospiraceae bacterium]|nr:SWIM zinc finger domain-containing protein [Oscillospiraceae bacterium]
MRAFNYQSQLEDGNLALALAPALTPAGIDQNPSFFWGFAVYPQVLARGLLVLADVTSTRYFNYTPVTQRDPILSAQGDRLRAECFSACNGVYARLDLLQSGFDGKIERGTTNVDIGMELRTALTRIKQQDKLHVNIGVGGLTASHISGKNEKVIRLEERVNERPVQMPDRWVRALGNAAEIHKGMKPVFILEGAKAQAFIASLPPATGKNQSGWLTPSPLGAKLTPRRTSDTVYVSGLHRLSAIKRIMTNISGIIFYMPMDDEPGPFMIEVELPCARLTLSLTAEAWHGYSGEGALLESLASQDVLEDAESINSTLEFNAMIDETWMANRWDMNANRVQAALTLLAVSGKLGFDAHDQAYFHRELPDDPDRVLKDNPRLVAARKLVGTVKNKGENQWAVPSNGTDYMVIFDPVQGAQKAKCTCTWYLNHQNKRGPCKHILAVQLKEETRE